MSRNLPCRRARETSDGQKSVHLVWREEHGLPECLPVGYSLEADAIPVSSLREHGVASAKEGW